MSSCTESEWKPRRALPRMIARAGFRRGGGSRAEAVQAWTDGVGTILGLLDQLRGNDDVCVDRPEWDGDARCELLAPLFGLAHRIFVADQEGAADVGQESLMRLMRGASHEEGCSSPQIGLDVGQALIKKRVVAKIGVRKVRYGGEVHEQRQSSRLAMSYCQVDGVVIDSALRPLHPVDDASALWIGPPIPPHGDARIAPTAREFLAVTGTAAQPYMQFTDEFPHRFTATKMRPEGRILPSKRRFDYQRPHARLM